MNKRALRKHADPQLHFPKTNGCSTVRRSSTLFVPPPRILMAHGHLCSIFMKQKKQHRDNVLRRLRFSRPRVILSR